MKKGEGSWVKGWIPEKVGPGPPYELYLDSRLIANLKKMNACIVLMCQYTITDM